VIRSRREDELPGALVGAANCGRCGAPIERRGPSCAVCGVTLLAAAPGTALGTYSGLLGGVAPAVPLRRRLAALIDAVAVAIPIIVGIGLLAGGLDAAGLLVVLAGVAGAAAQVLLLTARGRSLGRRLLGLRTVDDLTALPVTAAPALAALMTVGSARGAVTADLRRGRDPLASGLLPLETEALGAEIAQARGRRRAEPAATARATTRTATVVLALDSGVRLEVSGSLLIGRTPVNPEGSEHPVYAWPDLNRSLSKTHALLEWAGDVLWVTDLQSANGTRLVGPDERIQPLLPGLPGPAGPGWTVWFGDHSLVVHSGPVEL
jgi:uncharacterized RDD family membrane protein YckC